MNEDAAIGMVFSDFIFLASAYEGVWPALSLTVRSFHRQCTTSVLIQTSWLLNADEADISK